MTPVSFTRIALSEPLEIGRRIAADNPARAETLVTELESACLNLSEFPQMGRARPDLGKDVRIKVHKDYVVIYRTKERGIEILHVTHGMRDLPALMSDLKDD